ncbi:hypothetical protein [Salmonella enterica]|uniref:hypothetical protein n=1 Tax=Salmonella enterica TaxID=28901 RepID=UPI00398C60D1
MDQGQDVTNPEKVLAVMSISNGKNIVIVIMSHVSTTNDLTIDLAITLALALPLALALALALAIDVVYAQHSSHFTVIGLIIKFVERKFN